MRCILLIMILLILQYNNGGSHETIVILCETLPGGDHPCGDLHCNGGLSGVDHSHDHGRYGRYRRGERRPAVYFHEGASDGGLRGGSHASGNRKRQVCRGLRSGNRRADQEGGIQKAPAVFLFQYGPVPDLFSGHQADRRCDQHPEFHRQWPAACLPGAGDDADRHHGVLSDQQRACCGVPDRRAGAWNPAVCDRLPRQAAVRPDAEGGGSGQPDHPGKSDGHPSGEVLCPGRLRDGKIQ